MWAYLGYVPLYMAGRREMLAYSLSSRSQGKTPGRRQPHKAGFGDRSRTTFDLWRRDTRACRDVRPAFSETFVKLKRTYSATVGVTESNWPARSLRRSFSAAHLASGVMLSKSCRASQRNFFAVAFNRRSFFLPITSGGVASLFLKLNNQCVACFLNRKRRRSL